jgi:hypothetical protein
MHLTKIKVVVLTLLATSLVSGVEKSAASSEQIAYVASDVKVVGVLRYGQTSGPVAYSDTPQYRAFVFEGHGNDRIEVTVTGAGQNAFVAVADPALNAIASGTGHLSVTLPDRGPDPETFYVVFKDRTNRQTRISVQLKKNAGAGVSSDATR